MFSFKLLNTTASNISDGTLTIAKARATSIKRCANCFFEPRNLFDGDDSTFFQSADSNVSPFLWFIVTTLFKI